MEPDLPALSMTLRPSGRSATAKRESGPPNSIECNALVRRRQNRYLGTKSWAVSLFAKSRRGVQLTAAGRRLRDASPRAFDGLRVLVRRFVRRQAPCAPFCSPAPGSLLARWFISPIEPTE